MSRNNLRGNNGTGKEPEQTDSERERERERETRLSLFLCLSLSLFAQGAILTAAFKQRCVVPAGIVNILKSCHLKPGRLPSLESPEKGRAGETMRDELRGFVQREGASERDNVKSMKMKCLPHTHAHAGLERGDKRRR